MASIKLTQFGGISPSVDPRKLAPEGAQVAENLDLRFGDFRPTKGLGPSVATVPLGTRSIFRTPSGVWLSSLADAYWVNGQIPDAESERVYLTGRSAYPEAWQGGTYRRLGVPAPTLKPIVEAVINAQFDSTAASEAQKAAATAVVTAILDADTQAYLGAAVPPAAASPSTFDLDYPKVALHVSFDTLVGGEFVDLSPQAREIYKGAGATQGTDNTGPLGAPGAGYYQCSSTTTGGLEFAEIRRWRDEVDATWCVEYQLTAAVTYTHLVVSSRDYNMRELGADGPSGWGSLLSSPHGGRTNEDLRCQRTGGTAALPAGVPTHVALQCNGASVKCFIDGVLCGTIPYALGLEADRAGYSPASGGGYVGKMDELRVTLGRRYVDTGFAKPTAPFPTAALPTGLMLAHGVTPATPTDSGRDAAYLIELTASGGGYVATNPVDEYLRLPPFVGSQLDYLGDTYWAVALDGWRADGLAITEATIATELALVDNPASPGTPLLDSGQVALLSPLLFALYDVSKGDLAVMVSAINTAQAELRAELAKVAPVAATVALKLEALTKASDALTAHFAAMDSKLRTVLAANESTLFGSIQAAVVARDVQTRTYIVTFISDWYEESAPSPAADLLSVDQNDSITVTAPAAPSGRNIIGWRLYRSATSSTGAAWALVVDEGASNALMVDGEFMGFSISNRIYSDSQADEKLQEPCATLTWAEPPEDLQGLVGMPNGIMVGFFGKTLCFSVPFQPHAWPVEYQLTLEHDMVGIGVFGQTAVALTKGFPYYVSGADSASMSAQKIEVPQACIAPRSIATVDGGVAYASPDGLCLASASGIDLLTQGAFSKEDWMATVTAEASGAFHDGAYYLYTG